MSISSQSDLLGIKKVSEVVGLTLKMMREFAKPGMSTRQLDAYGGALMREAGARPAPYISYGFPGHTCISVNREAAHGIPSEKVLLKEGDLVNIDVSAELDGYFADNGGSFVLGPDLHNHNALVETSKRALFHAINHIKGGVKIAEIGRLIETEAKRSGFNVIRNLVGHGIGRSLHEEPSEIPNFYDKNNIKRFRKNTVVAVETFISTKASYVYESGNGWTYTARDGSFIAQHEHTIIVTDERPVILTASNGIWEA
jgi:methionyl aminopeptidase